MNHKPNILLYNMMIIIKIKIFKPLYIWRNIKGCEDSLVAFGPMFLNH